MSSVNVPLSSEGVVGWRRVNFYDCAETCDHTSQVEIAVENHTLWICESCGDARQRNCLHAFEWIKQEPPFVDEQGNLFNELLLCLYCGLDGT